MYVLFLSRTNFSLSESSFLAPSAAHARQWSEVAAARYARALPCGLAGARAKPLRGIVKSSRADYAAIIARSISAANGARGASVP